MRTTLILPAVMLAMIASSAPAQDMCPKNYESCMAKCIAGAAATQDRCIEGCQAKNTECFQRQIGGPSASALQPNAEAEPAPARNMSRKRN